MYLCCSTSLQAEVGCFAHEPNVVSFHHLLLQLSQYLIRDKTHIDTFHRLIDQRLALDPLRSSCQRSIRNHGTPPRLTPPKTTQCYMVIVISMHAWERSHWIMGKKYRLKNSKFQSGVPKRGLSKKVRESIASISWSLLPAKSDGPLHLAFVHHIINFLHH